MDGANSFPYNLLFEFDIHFLAHLSHMVEALANFRPFFINLNVSFKLKYRGVI